MTTTAIVIILVALIIAGLALLIVSQMREKSRIEKMRRIKALEDGRALLRRFIDELPQNYLNKTLRRLILERSLELSTKLQQMGAPGDVNARVEADRAALSAAETGQSSGPAELPANDLTQVKEIRHLLQMLYRFVEKQKSAGHIRADQANEQLRHIMFLVHKAYADVQVGEAQQNIQTRKYRRAIHNYYLAANELQKSKDHPDAKELIKAYQEKINTLKSQAEGTSEQTRKDKGKAVPESVNREWEHFIEEEESWKKKPDYDA